MCVAVFASSAPISQLSVSRVLSRISVEKGRLVSPLRSVPAFCAAVSDNASRRFSDPPVVLIKETVAELTPLTPGASEERWERYFFPTDKEEFDILKNVEINGFNDSVIYDDKLIVTYNNGEVGYFSLDTGWHPHTSNNWICTSSTNTISDYIRTMVIYDDKLIVAGNSGKVAYFDLTTETWHSYSSGDWICTDGTNVINTSDYVVIGSSNVNPSIDSI